MAEAHKINDGLYVVPLGDEKIQQWRCKNLSRQDVYKLMSFLRNEVLYLC